MYISEYQCGEASEDSLFVACLYIVPAAQRQGIGKRLLANTEEEAGREGFSAVETIVRKDNTDNPSGPLPFWSKNGYTIMLGQGEYALVKKDVVIQRVGSVRAVTS
jgi:ribosomal protein S18 acetylase RimI-like enzyme